jgi:methylated-DNA-[protein]-cysteine S-methyltransferase
MSRRHATLRTSLGDLLVVADADGLTGIYFPGHWHPPATDSLGIEVDAAADPLFAELDAQLVEYLNGRRTEFDLPTAASGDAFEQAVWAMLREIPFGETTTYGAIEV